MILFCGDPHGYFEHIIEAVQALRPEAVILLGDLQPKRPLEVELARRFCCMECMDNCEPCLSPEWGIGA